MKIFINFLFLLLICQSNLLASVKLSLLQNDEYLRRGKITKVIFSTKDKSFIDQLKKESSNKTLNKWLYLLSVEFINDEKKGEYQVGASLILKEIPDSNPLEIELDKVNFKLELQDIKYHPDDASLSSKGQVFIEDYKLEKFLIWLNKNFKTIVFFTLVLLVGMSVSLYKIRRKILARKNQQSSQAYWKDKILKAKTRIEVEDLYKTKNKWKEFYSGNEVDEFLNYLNQIQYSNSWTEQEHEVLILKLETMKKSIG